MSASRGTQRSDPVTSRLTGWIEPVVASAGYDLEELVVTNSIPLGKDKQIPRITVLSVAPLLAEAIRRIHDEESVSTLFV